MFAISVGMVIAATTPIIPRVIKTSANVKPLFILSSIYSKGLTLKFVASKLEQELNKPYTLANLSNKLRNETITYREMKIIAKIIGCTLELK